MTACSYEIKQAIKLAERRVWQQACELSRQTAFAPHVVKENVFSWPDFFRERTPGSDSKRVRVLKEQDLQVCEQLDWAALVAVVGSFRSGKSALIQRLVRQEAPGQSCGNRWLALGGVRACVLEAFHLRGRLRFFEIDAGSFSTSAHLLCKADAVLVLCDQTEGVEGANDAMRLLASVQEITYGPTGRPPCFLVFSKADATKSKEDVYSAVQGLSSYSDLLAACEVVSVSAMDGAGIDLLLHLLAWRLLVCSQTTRQNLLERAYLGGTTLLHRTAGAMNPLEVFRAMLQRHVVEVA